AVYALLPAYPLGLALQRVAGDQRQLAFPPPRLRCLDQRCRHGVHRGLGGRGQRVRKRVMRLRLAATLGSAACIWATTASSLRLSLSSSSPNPRIPRGPSSSRPISASAHCDCSACRAPSVADSSS